MPSNEGILMIQFQAVYLWRAFNFGFDLQITKTLPRRRTTLQSLERVLADFKDDKTFIIYRWFKKSGNYTHPASNCNSLW